MSERDRTCLDFLIATDLSFKEDVLVMCSDVIGSSCLFGDAAVSFSFPAKLVDVSIVVLPLELINTFGLHPYCISFLWSSIAIFQNCW